MALSWASHRPLGTVSAMRGYNGSVGPRRRVTAVAIAATAVWVLAACGGSATPAVGPVPAPSRSVNTPAAPPPSTATAPEVNPAGDIPDNQVYVPYLALNGRFAVSVPEGWSRTAYAGAVGFTDKLNAVRIEAGDRGQAPTVESIRAGELPALAAAVPGYQPGGVTLVNRGAGPAVLITYRATSPPDPVTGRSRTDDVQRYEFWHAGLQVTLTLSGPQGADNIDPWRTVTDSLRWLS